MSTRKRNPNLKRESIKLERASPNCESDFETVNLLMAIHEAVGIDGGNQSVIDHTISVTYKLLHVERVHIIMITRDIDGKLMTSDSFQPEIDPSRGVAAVVAATGRSACINDAQSDCRFNILEQGKKFVTVNLICSAIKSTAGEVIGVISAFNKNNINGCSDCEYFDKKDEQLLELIALNSSVALSKASLYEQTSREKKRFSALVPVLKARSCGKPLDEILKSTVDVICQLLNTDLVSIYLVDHVTHEAVICASKDGLEGYTVSFGQGIAGTVAGNGKVVRIMDAYSDTRFDPNVDNCTGVITKTMMCVPVPGFKEEIVAAAVIQAINKGGGTAFDAFDEESLVLLCTELSNVLRSKAIELQELRSLTSNVSSRKVDTEMALQQSLLREYGSKRHKAPTLFRCVSRTDSFHARRNTLSSSGLIKPHGIDTNAVDMMSEDTVTNYLSSHSTDPFLLDDMTLIYLAKHMLDKYGLIERFQLNLDRLRQFLISVHVLYHKNNAFHNFKHAWGTMHLCYQILSHGADEYLTSLDIMSVLLAAICHDLDHPGNNNAFEVATKSSLAVIYSDDTVLERHHCATALKLLSLPEHDFLENLSVSDKIRLRKTITASIMATDMSQHFSLVSQLSLHSSRQIPFVKKDGEERIILARLILHCADIGAQTQSKELALKWTERCLDEFSSQGAKEKILNLELTPFMQGLDNELTRMQLQVGFVGGIVVPLWSALAGCFQNLEFAASQAVNNKLYYSDQVTNLMANRSNLKS